MILLLLLLLQSSKDISTLEALGKYFRCTGSSMEVLAEEWSRREDGGLLGIDLLNFPTVPLDTSVFQP